MRCTNFARTCCSSIFQMPRISGLEMVGMLDPAHRPYIVFLTAFDEYAVKAFGGARV
ncbi:Hypothetical response regulatory protein yehT [Enterobacter asburiae]|uniref:Hypothetical response regulatory protein yehT n=1 Tax=Enterobacter asburiae TaxID=61645 RepID=A0A376FMP0_ENTAS|nr:Hypothetical response regulatory protein yehT [Enterobacter asburiae]